jgi:RNA polymerase sigma-70 factor (ECF subfamily)
MIITQPDFGEFFFHRFKSGDELAFERIFKSGYRQIVGFCDQFINDHDKAQSLAQEAFINLWLNREKVETVNGIKSFLFTYARSGCLNYLRHKKVANKYQDKLLNTKEADINREVLESFDFHSIEVTELEEIIQRSINELPDKCREVFVMSRFGNKRNKEIAEELGITEKAVEANITRAIKTLKSSLSDYFPMLLVQLIMQYLT